MVDKGAILKDIDLTIGLLDQIKKPVFDEKELRLFHEVIQKNTIISLYSYWEQFVKDIVFDSYKSFDSLLFTPELICNYIENAFAKRYTKRIFLENIRMQNSIFERDILCSSNNINYQEMKKLFQKVSFNTSGFNELFAPHLYGTQLEEIFSELNQKGFSPIQRSQGKTIEHKVESHIDTIVEYRNNYAHVGTIDIRLDGAVLKALCQFLSTLLQILKNFQTLQLYHVASQHHNKDKYIYSFPIINVIRENTGNNTAIVSLEFSGTHRIDENFILIGTEKDPFAAYVRQVRNSDGNEVTLNMLDKGEYSLEIDSQKTIRRENENYLWSLFDIDSQKGERKIIQI